MTPENMDCAGDDTLVIESSCQLPAGKFDFHHGGHGGRGGLEGCSDRVEGRWMGLNSLGLTPSRKSAVPAGAPIKRAHPPRRGGLGYLLPPHNVGLDCRGFGLN